tara:strand:- start:9455 stop:10747 length:1293 start_codon:yes stop_codon:yes gene_type:complete
MTVSLIGFLVVFLLMGLRVPIAIAMGLVGFAGLALLRSWDVSLISTVLVIKSTGFSYTLSVIPLFLLMGNIAARAGMASELFELARSFLGHRRGGVAMAAVGASGGFGAICGSSIATTATIAKVAYPEMRKLGYSEKLISGTIASGGTLGILIPPSTILIIYGILTETNIGKLFAAAFLPGLLSVVLMCSMVAFWARLQPQVAPRSARQPWSVRLRALRKVWGVVALFLLVIGGIYGGLFTATEGAGFGAFGTLALAVGRRRIGWAGLAEAVNDSTRTTAILFAILMGALIFGNFINFTGMPWQLQQFVEQFSVNPTVVVLMICAIYLLLGCVMEELSMIMLTIPVFFPIIVALGLDPYWFGIVVVMVVMIGMISPPVGMNLFVLSSITPGLSIKTIYQGVIPFIAALLSSLLILILFPDLATLLTRWVA